MEELLNQIVGIGHTITSGPDLSSIPQEALPWSAMFSAVGAVILGRYTGSMGNLTLPLNFSALFLGAVTSNWLLKGLDLPIDRVVQQPLLVTMIGMLFGALLMVWWMQDEHRKA